MPPRVHSSRVSAKAGFVRPASPTCRWSVYARACRVLGRSGRGLRRSGRPPPRVSPDISRHPPLFTGTGVARRGRSGR